MVTNEEYESLIESVKSFSPVKNTQSLSINDNQEMMINISDTIIEAGNVIYAKSDLNSIVYVGNLSGKTVALKGIKKTSSSLQEIKREYIGLYKIKNNITPLNHSQEIIFNYFDEAKAVHIFCSKYCKGPTFGKFLNNPSLFNDSWILRLDILIEIAIALQEIFRINLAHHDVKPENIICITDAEGKIINITLIDFGSSEVVSSSATIVPYVASKQGSTSMIIATHAIANTGTGGYHCPTRKPNKKATSMKTDIFRFYSFIFILFVFIYFMFITFLYIIN
jgi:serine/threonine protein kinase